MVGVPADGITSIKIHLCFQEFLLSYPTLFLLYANFGCKQIIPLGNINPFWQARHGKTHQNQLIRGWDQTWFAEKQHHLSGWWLTYPSEKCESQLGL